MPSFPDVMDLFTHELARLRARRCSSPPPPACAFDGHSLGHGFLLLASSVLAGRVMNGVRGASAPSLTCASYGRGSTRAISPLATRPCDLAPRSAPGRHTSSCGSSLCDRDPGRGTAAPSRAPRPRPASCPPQCPRGAPSTTHRCPPRPPPRDTTSDLRPCGSGGPLTATANCRGPRLTAGDGASHPRTRPAPPHLLQAVTDQRVGAGAQRPCLAPPPADAPDGLSFRHVFLLAGRGCE
jgi:hypothetical protein